MQVSLRHRQAMVIVATLSSLVLLGQMPAYSGTEETRDTAIASRSSEKTASSVGTRKVAQSGQSCCGSNPKPTDEDFTFDVPEDGCDPVRFLQARYLIEENREFIAKGKLLHEKMQEQILIAKTLKGEANMLLNQVPAVAPPKLKGVQLQSAVRDYTKDLQTFVNNANRYKFNLQTFRSTIGECHRAQAAYDQQRGLYNLHCDQFHVNGLSNIEPPHICGQLNATAGEAGSIAGMLRADEQKLSASMQELRNNSALVTEGRNMVAANLTATATESVRQREEEKLAKEFGRLREEYEMLKIQSKMLGTEKQKEAGRSVKSVSGNVVKSK
jgi:hypothetical protein